MDNLNASSLIAIERIPGLYISDMLFPQSTDLLLQHGVTHVLSLTNARNCPRIPRQETRIDHLHMDIEDNPMEDLLVCLDGLCAWIAHALATGAGAAHDNIIKDGNTNNENPPRKPKVLVHCIQGISRSGAVIVAYLMRSLSISYDEALSSARNYRPLIAPNSGFEDQLQIWEELGCSVFEVETLGEEIEVVTKKEYEEWKDGRGVLLSKVEVERENARLDAMKALI